MNRKIRIAALLLALAFMFSACGASTKAAEPMEAYQNTKAEAVYDSAYVDEAGWTAAPSVEYEMPVAEPAKAEEAEAAAPIQSFMTQPKADVKLIYTANISVQTLEYDKSVSELRDLVESFEGYFENVYTYNGGYNEYRRYRSANFTVRVPSDRYSDFIGAVGEGFYVVNQNESVQDIGLQYSETEGHIKTLKIKQERLQELLAQAVKMEDIIGLESALSECEYELESYTSTLNRYDSLIGYSTVYIDLAEVERREDTVYEEPTFGEKIAKRFTYACEDFVRGCQNFVLWIVTNMFTLAVIAVIIAFLFIVRPFKRLFRKTAESFNKREEKRMAKKAAKNAAKENEAVIAVIGGADGKNDGDDNSKE